MIRLATSDFATMGDPSVVTGRSPATCARSSPEESDGARRRANSSRLAIPSTVGRDQSARGLLPLSLRGEGWGEGQTKKDSTHPPPPPKPCPRAGPARAG